MGIAELLRKPNKMLGRVSCDALVSHPGGGNLLHGYMKFWPGIPVGLGTT